MKILLVGYGKMGKIIERVALERGHTIAGRIDIDNQSEIDTADADVAIEFSRPEAAFNNVKRVLERGIPVVCGTTGWLNQKPEAEKICLANNTAFFYASNYSVGVNIFFKVNEYLAKLMNGLNDYEITMDEIHHTEKKDAPSGTAITLAEGILKNVNRKKTWVNDEAAQASDLLIKSFRIDQVPGTHLVNYSSAIDNIEIKHIAHSREGFAKGAVLVAEWLKDKKGILNMDDFLKF
ncbi:MAG TPA: 4-hydroxy-tetrahydrodipicolinate reductase [Cyclobacteriaceae bacterium]